MNNSLRCQFILTVIISLSPLNVRSNSHPVQVSNEDDVKSRLPKDFMRFLESIDLNKNASTQRTDEYFEETTISTKARNGRRTAMNTQKNALRDVLMMKLVSYYEDKYRISPHDDRQLTKANNRDKYIVSPNDDMQTSKSNYGDKYRMLPNEETKRLATRSHRGDKYLVSRQYDRMPQKLYRSDKYKFTHHNFGMPQSKASYERDMLTEPAEYDDNTNRQHHYDTIVPTTSAEVVTTNKFAISMIPRRTLDITDTTKDKSISRNSVAEVIIL